MASSRSQVFRWLLVVFAIAGFFGVLRFLGIPWASLKPEQVRAYVLSFGWWAPAVFFLIYAQPLVPLPITVMCMAAGLAFGLLWGFLLALVTTTVRACGQFLLARILGRETTERILGGRMASLRQRIADHGAMAVIWIRFVPNVPFDLQSVALGCSQVPLLAFVFGTLIGIAPWVLGSVCLGQSLVSPKQFWMILAALVLVSMLPLMRYCVRRKQASSPC